MSHDHRTPRGSGSAWLFALNFFRHPMMLGSIVPSSRFLIRQLLEPVDWAQARVIVEYGPGVGVITTEVLRRMGPDAMLIAIETNPDFVSYLRDSIKDERRTSSRAPRSPSTRSCGATGKATPATSFPGFPSAPFPPRCVSESC